ncbi:hypothetical protein [Sphingobacterium psychroaquaticum]|uniref:Uncharacterized protein n=1 Tax=Sphingobacterium psychroaquaticum TaxID=561061 RepID=A0A1X7J1F4_9SPHI|nr:hypothetical protein [Sphingobacterium psychroaquaticum]QBQ40248.1 hypothetical protein E2P86_03420 [Sphingobacterium psychroaquaticum]SMG20591.1 hypothetical protein SAMN05660862_1259 [Sphingobacterium psychroaquaticum]
MKSKYLFVIAVCMTVLVSVFFVTEVSAQCAMCSLNAENSATNGNTQGKGLNDGILFLLAIPYLIAVGIGILWYKKYRKNHSAKQVSPFEK